MIDILKWKAKYKKTAKDLDETKSQLSRLYEKLKTYKKPTNFKKSLVNAIYREPYFADSYYRDELGHWTALNEEDMYFHTLGLIHILEKRAKSLKIRKKELQREYNN